MYALDALLDGLIVALKADSGVTALVGAKIYDEVPRDARNQASDASAPYVYVGPIGRRRSDEEGCAQMWVASVRLYAVSTAPGRREAWRVANAIGAALNMRDIDLAEGFASRNWIVVADGDVVRPTAPKEAFVDLTCFLHELNAFFPPGVTG